MSRDAQETSDRFRKSLDLPYPLVGDPEGTIVRAYRVSWPLIGLAQRVSYLIGQDRKIHLALHHELDIEAHMVEVGRALTPPA